MLSTFFELITMCIEEYEEHWENPNPEAEKEDQWLNIIIKFYSINLMWEKHQDFISNTPTLFPPPL